MLLRRFTDFILRGPLEAIGVTLVLTFIPLIGSVSILIAAFITLRRGAFEGALVFLAATVPVFVTYTLYPPESQTVLLALVLSNLLTWLLALVLRQYHNWNLVLEAAGFIGILVVVLLHIVYPDIQTWWGSQLTIYVGKVAEYLDQVSASAITLPQDVQLEMVANAKPFATGYLVVTLLFNALVQLLIARWWQAVDVNPGGLRNELHSIRLSYAAGIIFIAAMVLAFLDVAIAQDILPVLYGVFCGAGLSLIHCSLANNKISGFWLAILYAVLILFTSYCVMLIAVIGLLDTILDFRIYLRKAV